MPLRTVVTAVLLIVAACIALPAGLSAQIQSLPAFVADGAKPTNTSRPVPPSATFMRVNMAWFDTAAAARIGTAEIRAFRLPDGSARTLRLQRFDVLAPTGVVVEGTTAGDRPVTDIRGLFFRGTVDGVPGSFVYLALFPGFATGYIEVPRAGTELPQRFLIAPDNLDNPVPTVIVYDEADAPTTGTPPLCGTTDGYNLQPGRLEDLRHTAEQRARISGGATPASEAMLVSQIAIECDDDFYRVHSSNLSRAANYALAIMGAASAVYQRDIGVALEVPYLRIWTAATNPFPGPNDGDLLGQIRNHWESNMQGIERTSAILMTSYRGGVAWVGTMCGGFGYAMAGEGGNFNFPATGYVWDVDVTSHELGHNFGSPHTHSCFWAPAVDSCYGAEGGCFATPNPRPGTIMSYCHLSVGTVLKFHPRVATFIRAAATNYPCVTPMPGVSTHDVAVVSIVTPATGGSVVKGAPFAPVALVRNLGLVADSNVSVMCTITDTSGAVVFTDTKPIAAIGLGATAMVTFAGATMPNVGVYQIRVKATVALDSAGVNNALARPFQALASAPAGSITVVRPNGGEVYAADSVVTVTWTQTGVPEATIDLSLDNGVSWRTVRWSQTGDSGRYSWTVPATPSRQAMVRVTNISDSRISDRSNAVFTIDVPNDAALVQFVRPLFNDTVTSPFVPSVEVRNNGSKPLENLPVRLTLKWRAGDIVVYDHTILVPAIAPGQQTAIQFPTTSVLPEGNLVMVARTMLANDRYPGNDSLGRTAEVIGGISPPSSITADGLDRAAVITWAASTTADITGYRLYRGRDPESLTPIATVRPTMHAFVDAPVANDSLYYYAVTSLRDTLESVYSPVAVADPVHQIAGDTLRRANLLSPASDARDIPLPANLVWQSVQGAELYQIQIAADPACADVIENYITAKSAPLTPDALTYGQTYHWRARAFNNSSTGPWSAIRSFSTGQSCAGSAVVFAGNGSGVLDTSLAWAGGPVTVEFWTLVKAGDLGQSSAFGVGAADNTGNRFQAHAPWSDGTLYWDYGTLANDSGRITASLIPYLDRWTHVALVSNGRNFKAIYLNGELVASGTIASSPKDLTGLRMGAAAGGVYPSKCSIDEFRIWDRVRTADEIRRDMSRSVDADPGLVARYRFDEGSGTTANGLNPPAAVLLPNTTWANSGAKISCVRDGDIGAPSLLLPGAQATVPTASAVVFSWGTLAGAGAYQLELARDASFTSTVAFVGNIGVPWHNIGSLEGDGTYYWRVRGIGPNGPGPWSASRSFRAATACVSRSLVLNGTSAVADIPSFTWQSRAVTLELWLYVDSADVRDCWLFYTGPADSAARLSSHGPWSNKRLVFDYGAYGNGGRLEVDYAPYLSKWTHVAMVSNGKNAKAIYLNGQLAGSATVASRLRWPRTGLVIGGNRNGTPFYKSRLTEFRLWNTARSAEAIRENMYHRLAGHVSGLVGYWPFNGSADTVVPDASGFGNNALLRGGPAWDTAAPFPSVITPEIAGPRLVLRDASGVTYSTPTGSGLYQWSVYGGTISGGQGTPAITVDWGNGTSGLVVLTTNAEGCDITSAAAIAISDGSGVAVAGRAPGVQLDVRPNPVGGAFEIPVTLPRAAQARVAIHDIRGELVAVVANAVLPAGTTVLRYDASALPSGVYAVTLRTELGQSSTMVTVAH